MDAELAIAIRLADYLERTQGEEAAEEFLAASREES